VYTYTLQWHKCLIIFNGRKTGIDRSY